MTMAETKEPTRLGDWQIEQEVDDMLLYLFKTDIIKPFGNATYSTISLEIKKIVTNAIKRHERTLVRKGLLMVNETEEQKEDNTDA